jgi:peroxiredoxin
MRVHDSRKIVNEGGTKKSTGFGRGITVAAVLLLAGYLFAGQAGYPPGVGDPAPDFTLPDTAGTNHTLTDYRGKVVQLFFWDPDYPDCRAELPLVQQMTWDYGEDYAVLAITMRWLLSAMKEFASQYEGVVVLNDSSRTVWNLYDVSGFIPLNYVVDPTGTVRYSAVGFNEALIRSCVEQYLPGVEEAPSVQPVEFSTVGANPVVGHSVVRFSLPKAANITLRIYSTSGALVRTFVNGQMPAGAKTVNWNLQDDAGKPVGSGLYLYELNAGSQVVYAKVSVLKQAGGFSSR